MTDRRAEGKVPIMASRDHRAAKRAAARRPTARDIMTAAPKTIAPDAPIADAIAIMNEKRITLLFAVEDGKPVGVVHMHDLLAAGVR